MILITMSYRDHIFFHFRIITSNRLIKMRQPMSNHHSNRQTGRTTYTYKFTTRNHSVFDKFQQLFICILYYTIILCWITEINL